MAIFRALSLLIAAAFILGLATSPIAAQQQTVNSQSNMQSGGDDSDELPIYTNVTGYIQEMTTTYMVINGLKIIIPDGMTLPGELKVGKVASLHGNLRNDDTIVIITIVFGYHLPTSTPAPILTSTPAATEAATQQATVESTAAATSAATESTGDTAGCDKPRQPLAVMISAAYNVSYTSVVSYRCQGYTFGVIARGYLLVLTSKDEGKDNTIDAILILRKHGNKWSMIIIMFDLHPDVTLIIFILDGGKASIRLDCGSGDSRKKSVICIQVSSGGGGGGSGGGGGGKGKGGMGDDD